MTTNAVAKIVSLKLSTIQRREAAMRAKVAEMASRQAAASSPAFAASYGLARETAEAELEVIVAARQIKEWAA